MYVHSKNKVEWISWENQGNALSKFYAPQERSYGIVDLPGKYQNVK